MNIKIIIITFLISLTVHGETQNLNCNEKLIPETKNEKVSIVTTSLLDSFQTYMQTHSKTKITRDIPKLNNSFKIGNKEQFVLLMSQLVDNVNSKILAERKYILNELKTNPNFVHNVKNKEILNKYAVLDATNKNEILTKIQTIDKEIAIAQAGIESGNGTSKYAKEFNNIYGIYDKPGQISKFNSYEECLFRYAEILNTNKYYSKYRSLKQQGSSKSILVKAIAKDYCEDKNYPKLILSYIKNMEKLLKS